MSTGLDVPRQFNLHVTKQRNHLELLHVTPNPPQKTEVNTCDKQRKIAGWVDGWTKLIGKTKRKQNKKCQKNKE